MTSSPITELAILPLLTPLTPSIQSHLSKAKKILESASGHTFTYYTPKVSTSTSSKSKVYIIGAWDSVAAHKKFLVSEENLGSLELLKMDVNVEGIEMWHVDMGGGDRKVAADDTMVKGIVRCHVKKGEKERNGGSFSGLSDLNVDGVKGGWRILEDGEKDEEWNGVYFGNEEFSSVTEIVEERLGGIGQIECCNLEVLEVDAGI